MNLYNPRENGDLCCGAGFENFPTYFLRETPDRAEDDIEQQMLKSHYINKSEESPLVD